MTLFVVVFLSILKLKHIRQAAVHIHILKSMYKRGLQFFQEFFLVVYTSGVRNIGPSQCDEMSLRSPLSFVN